MHAMTGEGLCLECFRQPDGCLRESQIEGAREVLARDRNVSIGQMALAQPDQALSLRARGLIRFLGCCRGSGLFLGWRTWLDREGHGWEWSRGVHHGPPRHSAPPAL